MSYIMLKVCMPNPCQKTVFYNLQLLLGMKSFPNWQVLLSKVSLSARLRLGINPSADHHAIIRSKSVICYFIEDHIWYPITMLVARILCCDKAYRPWMSMFVDKPVCPTLHSADHDTYHYQYTVTHIYGTLMIIHVVAWLFSFFSSISLWLKFCG